jgi:hypothetical protein
LHRSWSNVIANNNKTKNIQIALALKGKRIERLDVKLLVFFSTKGGVSNTLSPKKIMSGETLYYKKYMSLQLGQYCQVHEEDNPRNSQIARTKGDIYLGPSGNLQGGVKAKRSFTAVGM